MHFETDTNNMGSIDEAIFANLGPKLPLSLRSQPTQFSPQSPVRSWGTFILKTKLLLKSLFRLNRSDTTFKLLPQNHLKWYSSSVTKFLNIQPGYSLSLGSMNPKQYFSELDFMSFWKSSLTTLAREIAFASALLMFTMKNDFWLTSNAAWLSINEDICDVLNTFSSDAASSAR